MERLIQQNKDQKTTIEKLEEALKAEMEKNQSLAVAQRVMRSDSDESPHDLGPYTVSPAEEEHQNRHRSELPLASKAAQASASLSGANGDSVARLQPDRMFGLTEQDSNRNLAFPSTLRKVGGPVGFITAFPEASAITMQLRYGPAGSAGSGKDQADGDETSGVC
jgi:cell division septum initiation protein DivIVA